MRRNFFPLAVLILLAAAGLRLADLHTYPPGPHYDEAANVRIARSIAFGGADLFPIANSYQGRETLYHYLSVPLFRGVSDGIFALQLTSVFANILTVAATLALGRAMFRGERGIVIGLAAGAMVAFSFHQVLMARQAYRAVTLPMMQALALWCLWRGLHTRRDGPWLLAGGALAGGALYTYMASRLFPVWLALAGLLLLWLDRSHWRRRLRQGLIFFGALIVVALPMAAYALDNPDIFFQRLEEVSGGDVIVSTGHSIRRHIEMFFLRGEDGNLRYNVPDRPYFTPIEGALLLIGLAAAGWRLWHGRSAVERTAYGLTLLAPLMVIPSIIALGGLPPNHMRSLGMVPLIFVLVAVGVEAVLSVAGQRWSSMRHVRVPVGVIAAALLAGAVLTGSTYFNWAGRADLFYQADGDLATAADWLPDHTAPSDHVYIASFHREHPTILIALDRPVTWLGFNSLFLPPPGETGLMIAAHNAPLPPTWLEWLGPYAVDDLPEGPDGTPAFMAYRLTGDMALPDDIAVAGTTRTSLMTLAGFADSPTASGSTATVTLAWRIDQTPLYYRLRPVVRLEDGRGGILSETDVFLLGTSAWQPGETMLQRIEVAIPPGTPPGQYPVSVAWVDRDSDTYVSFINESGGHAGIRAQVGQLTVRRPETFPSPESLPMAVQQIVDWGDGARLLGWNPAPANARPGESLCPTLFWQRTGSGTAPEYEALLSGDNEVSLRQGPPGGDYNPSQWEDGEVVAERACWPLPDDLESGSYRLLLRGAGNTVDLGVIQITGLPRVFEVPPVGVRTDLTLGERLGLYGYTLMQTADSIELELVWTASAPVDIDYTVFVHLVDAAGTIIVQHDRMPVENSYPTGLWVAGEYVIDRHQFNVALGDGYRLRMGLYTQGDGIRLPILDESGQTIGDFFEIQTVNSESGAVLTIVMVYNN